MNELIELLNKYTTVNGSYRIDYNKHVLARAKTREQIIFEYFGFDHTDIDIFKLDLNKPIYFLEWFPYNNKSLYRFISNRIEGLLSDVKTFIESSRIGNVDENSSI